jgi:hypothetical protein
MAVVTPVAVEFMYSTVLTAGVLKFYIYSNTGDALDKTSEVP